MAAISAVLSRYEVELIREVTDPNTGIAATEKYMSFMPNAGELKVYCEAVAARRERIARLGALPAPDFNRVRLPPPQARPGDQATVFVPEGHHRYPILLDWSVSANPRHFRFGKSSDGRLGIWIAWHIWDDRQTLTSRPLGDLAKDIVADATPASEAAE